MVLPLACALYLLASAPTARAEDTPPDPPIVTCPDGAPPVGQPPAETFCQRSEGTRHGPYVRWHPDGSVRIEGSYRDGRQHGQWTEYDRGGRPLQRGNLVDGTRQGAWAEWYNNGNRRFQCRYEDGRVSGAWSAWNEDGSPAANASEVFFRDPPMAFMPLGSQEEGPSAYLVDLDGDGNPERLRVDPEHPDQPPPGDTPPTGAAHERVVRIDANGAETLVLDAIIGSWDSFAFSWAHGVAAFDDVDGDGVLEIVYYQGDDTWEETSIVFFRGEQYVPCTIDEEITRLSFVGSPLRVAFFDDEAERVVARWDLERGAIVGEQLLQVTAESVALHEGPGLDTRVIARLPVGNRVLVLPEPTPPVDGEQQSPPRTAGDLVRVLSAGRPGYIHRDHLAPWICPAE